MDYDPLEAPHTGIEILGRGRMARKSKTFIPSMEVAVHLGRIANHAQFLLELFRKLHARHYTIEVEVKREDGSKATEVRPHILSNEEIRDKYPVVAHWENVHQEAVEHFASIKGFSVIRTTSHGEERNRERGPETSAGTDRRERREEERWR